MRDQLKDGSVIMDTAHDHTGWPRLVADLHSTCTSAVRSEEAQLIGRLVDIARRVPAPFTGVLAIRFDDRQLHAWLDAGAVLSVASALMGPGTGYMLSRSPDGTAFATLVADGLEEEFSCFGESEAIALCGAICAALKEKLKLTDPAAGAALLH